MEANKSQTYMALGVATFIEHTIQEHRKQYGKDPSKVILGNLEWKLLGVDKDDDCYLDGILLTLNENMEDAIVVVDAKV